MIERLEVIITKGLSSYNREKRLVKKRINKNKRRELHLLRKSNPFLVVDLKKLAPVNFKWKFNRGEIEYNEKKYKYDLKGNLIDLGMS